MTTAEMMDVRVEPYGPQHLVGYTVTVKKSDGLFVGEYAFVRLDAGNIADRIRGDQPSDPAVTYIGDSFGKHYYTSHDGSDIPDAVYDALHNKGLTVYENVDGGWANWDGRPEWSDSYIDFSDATVVDG